MKVIRNLSNWIRPGLGKGQLGKGAEEQIQSQRNIRRPDPLLHHRDAGLSAFTYFDRATHSGQFVALPVEVSAMYDLTTWGRSATASWLWGSDRAFD